MPILATIRGLVRTIVHAHERMHPRIQLHRPTRHHTHAPPHRDRLGGVQSMAVKRRWVVLLSAAIRGVQAARRAGGRNSVGG